MCLSLAHRWYPTVWDVRVMLYKNDATKCSPARVIEKVDKRENSASNSESLKSGLLSQPTWLQRRRLPHTTRLFLVMSSCLPPDFVNKNHQQIQTQNPSPINHTRTSWTRDLHLFTKYTSYREIFKNYWILRLSGHSPNPVYTRSMTTNMPQTCMLKKLFASVASTSESWPRLSPMRIDQESTVWAIATWTLNSATFTSQIWTAQWLSPCSWWEWEKVMHDYANCLVYRAQQWVSHMLSQ